MAEAPVPTAKLNLPGLRHEILTPINHIIGYAEMLIEDSQPSGFSSVQQNLTRIRETARELTKLVDTTLSPRAAKRAEKALAELRHEMTGPVHNILQTVGAITSDEASGIAIADVMAIGRAAAELLAFAQGKRNFAAPEVTTNGAAAVKLPATGPGRVLVVDDDRNNRELIARQLKRLGHEVTAVSSGAEALVVLLQSPQEVVLLDMLMPKLDGFQVLERIKADPSLREIPVIVVSALNEVPGVVRSLEIGAEDYLFKPIDSVLLAARINLCLEKKRLHDLQKRREADLHSALERVQMSEQRLRLALAADRAVIWDLDLATNKVIEFTEDGREINRDVDQMIERVHPDDRTRLRANLFDCIQSRREFRDQYRVAARDGSIVWFETMGALHMSPEGKPVRMIGVTRNITLRKEVEEALRRSNQDFQRFAMAASHDLQEPLRAVVKQLDSLLNPKRISEPDDDERVLRSASRSLSRMSRLIADLLDYSQMGAQRPKQQPVNSEGVLELVLSDLKPAIEETRAQITNTKLPMVLADFNMLHRVFQNLLSNSIKYRSRQPLKIHVAAKRKGDWWVFSVSDNGVGIDPKYKDAIFGVFRRLHGSDVPGSGLGLAICHRIIEQLGGRIWLESTAGKGSTFYFTVPAVPRT